MDIQKKTKSKRGRKPKNMSKDVKIFKPEVNEDIPIITHLPIKLENEKSIEEKINKDDIITKLQKKLTNLENKISNNKPIAYQIKNDKNVDCWWCRHSFDTVKVELPENYYNDTFFCIGNFCSYNCASSYNIELNDENVYKRQSLLYMKYKNTYNEYKKIVPAPSWKILEKAGGSVSIEKYRENFINNSEDFIYLKPPMVSRIAYIEYIPMNKNFNTNEKYILKRNKPLRKGTYNLQDFIKVK